MKDVASQALRMHADQRRPGFYITHDEGNRFFDAPASIVAEMCAKTMDAEVSPTGWEIGRGDLFDCGFVHPSIIYSERRWLSKPAASQALYCSGETKKAAMAATFERFVETG
jgi:hypothetical protein